MFAAFDYAGNRTVVNTVITAQGDYVDLVSNGSGYGAVWSYQNNVYFAELGASGNILAGPTLISSSGANPNIVWSGSQYGISWWDNTGNDTAREAYFVRMNTSAVKQGSDTNVSGCGADWCGYPDLAWNGTSYGMVWKNVTDDDLYYTSISTTSAPGASVLLKSDIGPEENQRLVWSPAQSEYVLIYQVTDVGGDIELITFGNDGTNISSDFTVSDGSAFAPTLPSIVIDGGNYAVVWHDQRINSPYSSQDGEVYFAKGN